MNKFKIRKLLLLSLLLIVSITIILLVPKKEEYIDKVLSTNEYSYLPREAKNYIKDVYNKTGSLILTEKNKKENLPYLNPKFINYLTFSSEKQEEVDLIPNIYVVDYPKKGEVSASTLPSTYNIGNVNGKNFLSPYYNQGSLGLCWSFASIEQIESKLLMDKNQSYSSSAERFSVRQMDYATSTDGINNYQNENGYRPLTDGGNFFYSSTIMAYGLSLANDSYMPYNSSTTKKELVDILNFNNSKYELNTSVMMPIINSSYSNTVKEWYYNSIKERIMQYGGAYVGTASPQSNCGFINTDNKSVIVDSDDCVGDDGHAMHIIGWNDNYTYSYCKSGSKHLSVNSSGNCTTGTKVTETGAWIVKNSWGESSSYKTVYLGYTSFDADINFTTNVTPTSERTWDNVYHKNIIADGYTSSTSDSISFTKKINTTEKVEKIKFISVSTYANYKVSITSQDNNYNDIATIETDYPGTYSIDLSNKNVIINSNQFTVTITSTNGRNLGTNTLSVFTSNTDNSPSIKTDEINIGSEEKNAAGNYEFNVYSSTKNIPSNSTITYSLLKNGNNYNSYILSTTNNVVAENNVNAKMILSGSIPSGNYVLRTSYSGTYSDSNLIIVQANNLSGSGTPEDPYQIYTLDDFEVMRYYSNDYYILKNDITLNSNWTPIGTANKPFMGGLDGDNHTITGLSINSNSDDSVGLFGYVHAKDYYVLNSVTYSNKTYIKNLIFKNSNIVNRGNAGVLIGNLTIDNSYIPDGATSIEKNPKITIDNVHFINGTLKSTNGNAGVIIANTNNYAANYTRPEIIINNSYSSVKYIGEKSAGLIGFFNDSFISAEGIAVKLKMSNIQNVGIIDIKSINKSYVKNNYYSSIVGGVFGTLNLTLNNYIVNSTFNDVEYQANYMNQNDYIMIGGYAKNVDSSINATYSKGYFIHRFPTVGTGYTSSTSIKSSSLYNTWTDFNTYWKMETISSIKRIPVLKNIDYNYTNISDITIDKYNEVSLLDYIEGESHINYINYDVVSNNDVISINYNENDYDEDIRITGLKRGTATLHLINEYDGFEKDVNINVNAPIIQNPKITYYYNVDGNTNTYEQTVTANQAFQLNTNQFTRSGYRFKEWNVLPDGSGKSYSNEAYFSSGIDEDMRLYAQWEKIEYQITFYANDGTSNYSMVNATFETETSYYTLPANSFTRNHYSFGYWSTNPDGSGTAFSNRAQVTYNQLKNLNSSRLSLYAIWDKDEYRLTFNANGGHGEMSYMDIPYGETRQLPQNTFTKVSAKFAGWNTKANGTGTSYQNLANISLSSNLILYAQWQTFNFNIQLNVNDGTNRTLSYSTTYTSETGIYTLPSNTFTRAHYTFVNWNTKADGTGTSYSNQASITYAESLNYIDEPLKLYAQWEGNFDYIINRYTTDEINKYITKIMVNTTVDSFLESIELNTGYTVDVESKNNIIYTGGKTKIYHNNTLYAEYTNVVIGDINGDGRANSADLLRIRQHLLGVKVLTGGDFLSSDLDYNSRINSADLLRMRQHLLGIRIIS